MTGDDRTDRMASPSEAPEESREWYHAKRKPQQSGTSTAVTLPKIDMIEELGIDPEDLRDRRIDVRGVGHQIIIEIPEDGL